MNLNRRKFLALSAGLALTPLAASACAAGSDNNGSSTSNENNGDDPAEGAPVTLTFLTFETPNLDTAYWDGAIARASAAVPGVTIEKLVAPSADRTAYAKQLDASGQLPNIMISVNPNGFAQAGKFAAWDDDELTEFVSPQSNPIDGKIYQLPHNTQPTPLVYYNKSYFADAGITATPTTYAELVDVAGTLHANGINPFVVGGGGSDTWATMYPLIASVGTDVYQQSPDWLSDRVAGTTTFADPAFTGAVKKVADLAAAGYIDPAGLSRSYADSEQAFLDGKGAMYPMGSWFAAAADGQELGFEVGVFAWPSDSGKTIVPAYTGGGMSVSSSAPDVDLAKEWALAFMLDKENLDASVQADGSIIAIKGYQPPTMGAVYNASVKVYQAAAAEGGVVNAFSIETGDGSLLPGIADKTAVAVQDLITGRKSADEFCAYLDSEWEKA